MKVIEGFNEFFRKMSADEKKIFIQLIKRGNGAAVKIGNAIYFYCGDDIGPHPVSCFEKFDTLESYNKKDLPTVSYYVSYDEWYLQMKEQNGGLIHE